MAEHPWDVRIWFGAPAMTLTVPESEARRILADATNYIRAGRAERAPIYAGNNYVIALDGVTGVTLEPCRPAADGGDEFRGAPD